jgi:hypothetical protein
MQIYVVGGVGRCCNLHAVKTEYFKGVVKERVNGSNDLTGLIDKVRCGLNGPLVVI